MVKLLRLTSTDNCNFLADLDAGIALGENASIGLQNLTFESTDFTTFSIGSSNNEISFSLNRLTGTAQNPDIFDFVNKQLTIKSYTKLTINNFWEDLEATLNECLNMSDDTGTAYGNFKVLFPNETINIDKVVIVYKLAPMQMMFNVNESLLPRDGRLALMQSSRTTAPSGTRDLVIDTTDQSNDGINLGNIKLLPTLAATDLRKYFVYPREGDTFGFDKNFEMIEWSRGSGMFMVRVGNLVDNSGNAQTNGFSVGFSTFNLQETTGNGLQQIDDNEVFFEIRVLRPQDPYEFCLPEDLGVKQASLVVPLKVGVATGIQNDHILFERVGNVISGRILNTAIPGGTSSPIFSYTLSREQMKLDLLPYICVFGDETSAMVGHPNITFNPLINPLDIDGSNYSNDKYTITGLSQSIVASGNCFKKLSDNGFASVVPDPDDLWYSPTNPPDASFSPYIANTMLKLNGSILRLMGFNELSYPNNSEYILQSPLTDLNYLGDEYLQFNIIPDGLVDLTNSDNYIVLLDSNPLFSYDASKFDYTDTNNVFLKLNNVKRGRRKSILCTIPVNNNSGIVEYAANDPIYIDFDNKFKQELKNLRLRVLNKNFDEVLTTGESVITLLLNDK